MSENPTDMPFDGDGGTDDASRRSVLRGTAAALGAGATGGLAGCLSDDGGDAQFSPIADELTAWHAMGGENGER